VEAVLRVEGVFGLAGRVGHGIFGIDEVVMLCGWGMALIAAIEAAGASGWLLIITTSEMGGGV
jgi:hypothetical protein